MRDITTLRMAPFRRSPTDGWVGTLEYPGYRAGPVVARLDHLPEVDPRHLHLDVLLLDTSGRTRESHAGPCTAVPLSNPLDDRSRFVRLVAEFVRHAPEKARGLEPAHAALAVLREQGVGPQAMVAAAQLLDEASGERAVVDSLNDLLELCLGEEEAARTLADVVSDLARRHGAGSLDAIVPPLPGEDMTARVRALNQRGLARQLSYVVGTVGKARARAFLREVTDFDMVPGAAMFGV